MAPRVRIADGAADTTPIADFERDRRALLRRGLGLGGVVVAATSIPLLWSVRTAFAATGADGEILESAITLERIAVLAYGEAIGSKLLTPRFAAVVRRFREHERQHAATLSTALTDLGGALPEEPVAADVEGVAKGLGDAKSQADVANFLIELELAQVAAYYDAHAKLIDAKLLQTGVAIMANEAQHLVVLRQAVDKDPVPHAFENGSRP